MFYIWEVKFELKSDSVLAVQFFRFYRLQHITSGMRFDAFTTINRPYVLYTMHVWPAFSFLLFFFQFSVRALFVSLPESRCQSLHLSLSTGPTIRPFRSVAHLTTNGLWRASGVGCLWGIDQTSS